MYLSIVIPLYNEEDSLEHLYKRTLEASRSFTFTYEVFLIDDGSTDNTWKIIEELAEKNPHVKGIRFRRNFGQTAAMVAGFDHAQGKIIVTMDGDLQNDPNDIPLLLSKLSEGYDIVSGWRKDRKDHTSRVLPSMVANWIISKTTGVRLHDYGCSLKAYRADCIKSIRGYGEMHRFFPAFASMTGARVTEIPVRHHPRRFGTSKYGFDRIFKVFNDILATNLIIRFASKPLIGFTKFAIPLFLMAVMFGLLAAASLFFSWTSGKALFFLIVFGLLGTSTILLLLLGVIGELVVSFSDPVHADLPAIMKTEIHINHHESN
jgi:glycosyltransferase involved in cell wall biosynthesis